MVEAAAGDMHTFEALYETPGSVPGLVSEKVEALYWQAGADARGDDKRFVYFKDWRHRTVLAVKADYVVAVRMVARAH